MRDDSESRRRQGERNPAASVQQRLRNYAKANGDDVLRVLIRYLNERFLFRVSNSKYRDRFILRGATLFTAWQAVPHRATRDIDLLVTGHVTPAALQNMLVEICAQPVEEDGVTFLPETLTIQQRVVGRVYQGHHAEMAATISTARLRLEVDIATGEAVSPAPVDIQLPVLLDKPAPRLRGYRRKTSVAEKCEALVSLGRINTRMKDFYDLWCLSVGYSFEGTVLCDALRATFTGRQTAYPAGGLPVALTEEFSTDLLKQRPWSAFVSKASLSVEGETFVTVIERVRTFLQPPLYALEQGLSFQDRWTPTES